ncbi:LysR family transcriptional regulator [Acidovorax sp. NCPPB 4044]|uniref:LysR family transcriptional regulator n=1 Tax=Acidovorax sp. NCPPB 4044 TaxID=2940490 RepID=UPI002304454C|nr:LysR family transcriptional regulator [Acidovorax sp. NCPPB 4044]MDA8521170.1 LysR family transcriptional regulator [Acidovorax sp. NCPPB 4044]
MTMPSSSAVLPSGADRIELLQTFVRIVESGSLSAAAQQLATTQPTVSRRLQTLERGLGLRLLQRSTHGMKLTEDGERCLAHAKELLGNWQAMESDLRGAQDTPRGTLRVQAPHAFGQDQLIVPLTAYLRRYPDVSVEWLLHDRQPDFIAEGLDCAVQVGPVLDPSVIAQRIAEVPRIVVASPALLERHGGAPAHPRELLALPWLALRTYYLREVVLHPADEEAPPLGPGSASGAETLPIQPRMATDSLYALRNAALAGLGVALVSAWVVQDDLAAGRLLHIVPGWLAAPLPVHLVYPPTRHPPARLRAFLETLREAIPSIAGMRV